MRRAAAQERLDKKRAVEAHRDADQQEQPYTYKIARYGNETLAVRYGVANLKKVVDEYWYHGKGGVPRRNPDRDRTRYEDAETITLKKLRPAGSGRYEVELVDFGGRVAVAEVRPGSEVVKAFHPITDSWFDDCAALEKTLEAGATFTLKELARFHVQNAVRVQRR